MPVSLARSVACFRMFFCANSNQVNGVVAYFDEYWANYWSTLDPEDYFTAINK